MGSSIQWIGAGCKLESTAYKHQIQLVHFLENQESIPNSTITFNKIQPDPYNYPGFATILTLDFNISIVFGISI